MSRKTIIIITCSAVGISVATILFLNILQRVSLDGTWRIEFNNPLFQTSEALLRLTEKGNKLSGLLITSLGSSYIVEGERQGNEFLLKATLSLYEGRVLTLRGVIIKHGLNYTLQGDWTSNTSLDVFGFPIKLGNAGSWRAQKVSSTK